MDTAEATSIVAVAAEPGEFRGLVRRASSPRRLRWGLQFAREAEVDGRKWILVADGPGAILARRAAETALDRTPGPAVLLSTGYCGALDPALPKYAILVADEVWEAPSGKRSRPLPIFCDAPAARGMLLSLERVAVTAFEKRQLREHGPVAVEMEAAGVAAAAVARNVPFFCVRVVTDTAGEDLVLDFNRYRDGAGRFSRSLITKAVLLHPNKLARLLRFNAACRQASQRLGEFLVHCRF